MLKLKIKELFSKFNYEIGFNNKNLLIITGPNGFGKTTILNIINNINKGKEGIIYFYNLNFKSIEIINNNKNIYLNKNNNNDLTISIKDLNNKKTETEKFNLKKITLLKKEIINNSNLNEDKITIQNLLKNNNIISEEELILKDLLKIISLEENKNKNIISEQFMKKFKLDKEIYFIKEQRLIKYNIGVTNNKNIIQVINELPKDLIKQLDKLDNEYFKISNKLDSTYLNRVFNNNKNITEEEFNEKIKEIFNRFERLEKYGLIKEIDINYLKDIKFCEKHKENLIIYFNDLSEKFKIYENFINKLELYTKIINNKLYFKRLVISKDNGLKILNEQDKEIPLEGLSSGEKQQIVLFYQLIFNLDENKIILIDEPEISLHIKWQIDFINNLIKVIENKKVNVIVTTHSPDILNSNWEYNIDLNEIIEEDKSNE